MNDKQWYKKGYNKGYKDGQKMMINLVDGSAIVRSDNLAYIMGRMSKEQEIRDAISEINQIEINGYVDSNTMFMRTAEQVKNMAIEIISRHTGVQE